MEFWFTQGMCILPIFVVIWTYLTFGISYIISVKRGDVDPGFPYISDTGARRPESSIFGQMLNITAAVALVTLYVRYKQVEHYLIKLPDNKISHVYYANKIAWILSFFICFGMSLVANFQETSVLSVHILGAMLTFFGGTIYMFIQSFITYKMHPEVNGKSVFIVRLVLSVLGAIFIITEMVCTSGLPNPKMHWDPHDYRFGDHLASTIVEWLLAASFLAFFLTLIRDFQKITLSAEPTIHSDTLHHNDDSSRTIQFRPEERTPLVT